MSDSAKKTVLLVEDDQAMFEALQLKLEATGFNFLGAHDGEEAVRLVNANKPDLILLDLILPGIDGWQVLDEIKKKPELEGVPVIILTNLGIIQEIEKGKAMGATDYLIKSNTSINDVVKIVQKHLGSPA